jgi:hypothetical protein
MLGDKRLFFCKSIPNLTELYNELEAFPKGTYSDQVCSISLLVNHFGNFASMVAGNPVSLDERKERMYFDRIHGLGKYAGMVQDSTILATQGPTNPMRDPLAEAGLFG